LLFFQALKSFLSSQGKDLPSFLLRNEGRNLLHEFNLTMRVEDSCQFSEEVIISESLLD
jgi:hypothetical protein